MKKQLMNAALLTGLLALASPLKAQHFHPPAKAGHVYSPEEIKITLMPGLGTLHHPVTTANKEAQLFFDQGFTFMYAFNHDAAYYSFKKAAEIDPQLAMAYWGMALALGTNINIPITPENEKEAYDHIQRALKLMPNATANEQAYIKALSKRYSLDPNRNQKKLETDYSNAMKEVMQQFPDDLDVATLYAESAMNINPWNQWTLEGKPRPGTLEIVGVLESVIKRNPHHLGANHYYIHAVEASEHPEWALMSAKRLPFLAPASGHIQHMPSHIYMLLGDYEAAASANEAAIAADKAYIRQYGIGQIYPVHYMSHNLAFLSRSYAMGGNFERARGAANELAGFYTPHFEEMPELEYYYSVPAFALLRFHRWQDVLQLPPPQDPKMAVSKALWHFARALAFAALKEHDQSEEEQAIFQREWKQLPQSAIFGSNSADQILSIANDLLDAKQAEIKGNLGDAIAFLKRGVKTQDELKYSEPPDWFFPMRESLGGALMRAHQYKEAEAVFRADLEKHPRNGRDLFGLLKSLEAQGLSTNAFWVEREFKQAWKNSDTPLTIDNL
jgi:tetratricopeptide (TPR) repeat protein